MLFMDSLELMSTIVQLTWNESKLHQLPTTGLLTDILIYDLLQVSSQ